MDFNVIAQAGLTQQEFAKLCGVSRVTANLWVRSRTTPHQYIKPRIAAIIGQLQRAYERGDFPLKCARGERLEKARAALLGE